MKSALVVLISIASAAMAGLQSNDVYDGQPRFDQGDMSYYVWRDGGNWHVRWVASDRGRDFKGVVAATGGAFRFFQENDSEKETLAFLSSQRRMNVSNDRNDPGIRLPDAPSVNRAVVRRTAPDRIEFDARTTNSIGGFDFVPDDSVATVQLDLQIDSKSVAGLVRLGKKMKKASSLPLVVTLRGPPPAD